MVKTALADGDCQTASQAISRGTEARFPRERLAEVNRLQFDIARCYQRAGSSSNIVLPLPLLGARVTASSSEGAGVRPSGSGFDVVHRWLLRVAEH